MEISTLSSSFLLSIFTLRQHITILMRMAENKGNKMEQLTPPLITDPNLIDFDNNMDLVRLFTLIDLDELYRNSPGARIVNSRHMVGCDTMEEFTKQIYSSGEDDIVHVESCSCGKYQGTYFKGQYCPDCGTEVKTEFIDDLTHTAWLDIPEEMGPVMNPQWYKILSNWTNVKDKETKPLIDVLLNPSFEFADPELTEKFKGRGFKYFHDHHDEILDFFMYTYPRTAKKPIVPWLEIMRKEYPLTTLFTRKLAILHSSLHPLKSGGKSLKYTDQISGDILKAVIDLSWETHRLMSMSTSEKKLNISLHGIYQSVIAYYHKLVELKLGGKGGLLRKHDFGSRIHGSFRTVAISHGQLIRPADQVILPWKIMVSSLRIIIYNFLMSRFHYSAERSIQTVTAAMVRYDPVVNQCIEMMRDECPEKSFHILINRNPTINLGSIMSMRCVEWFTDPKKEVMAISPMVVKPGNIDFDGDELNGAFVFENYLRQTFDVIHPSSLMLSTEEPGISPDITLLQQNFLAIANWHLDDPDTAYFREIS